MLGWALPPQDGEKARIYRSLNYCILCSYVSHFSSPFWETCVHKFERFMYENKVYLSISGPADFQFVVLRTKSNKTNKSIKKRRQNDTLCFFKCYPILSNKNHTTVCRIFANYSLYPK